MKTIELDKKGAGEKETKIYNQKGNSGSKTDSERIDREVKPKRQRERERLIQK